MTASNLNARVRYLEVQAEVSFWEDASINDVDDDDNGTLIPFKDGELWCPVIRLEDGVVLNWPQDMTAEVHYKVGDLGEYWLLDEHKVRVAKWADYYVPNTFLCPGTNGYGDYIILTIDASGKIKNWTQPFVSWDPTTANKCYWKPISQD